MRIVYVEDNIANVHLVKRVARMGKHEIINYIDGMDALNNFVSDKPDLVLMDIQLAGELTGIEVVQKLRANGHTTPIIAVTAYAMVGDKERCIQAGCTGYMSKPIPVTDLVNLFKEYDTPAPSELADKTPSVTDVPQIKNTTKPTVSEVDDKPDTQPVRLTNNQSDVSIEKDTPKSDDVSQSASPKLSVSSEDSATEQNIDVPEADEDVSETQPTRQTLKPADTVVEDDDKLSDDGAPAITPPEEENAVPSGNDKQAKMQ